MAGVFRKFVGGATEPFCSRHTQYSLHMYEVVSVEVYAKFHDLVMMIWLSTHKRHHTILGAWPLTHRLDFGKVDHSF